MGQGGILKPGKQRRKSHLRPHPRIRALFPEPSRNRCRPPETVPPRKRAGATGVSGRVRLSGIILASALRRHIVGIPHIACVATRIPMLIGNGIRRGSGSLLAVVLRRSDSFDLREATGLGA